MLNVLNIIVTSESEQREVLERNPQALEMKRKSIAPIQIKSRKEGRKKERESEE